MLTRLFIKKPTLARVKAVLDKEDFIYTDKDVEDILKGNQKGVRYGSTILVRNEDGEKQKRFIKLPLDGKWETHQLFRRQVKVTYALQENKAFRDSTIAIVKASLAGPIPYAIFETRENGDNFGFMYDTPESYDTLTEQDVRRLVRVIYSFHHSGLSMDKKELSGTRDISSRLRHYTDECKKVLDKKIKHRYQDGSEIETTVEKLLVHYTKISDLRERILKLLQKNWAPISSSRITKGSYLVNADMQIDNVYKNKNGNFEFFDLEWVGRTDDPAIAIMYDYGYLRARAWFSPSFQSFLDEAMREIGLESYKNPAMIGAALKLGVIRSSLNLSRYHLDVVNTLKNGKRTEEQYRDMYSKTIATLTEAITTGK